MRVADNDRVNGCANTSNQLAVRKYCENSKGRANIFNGPLATKDEVVKVQYLMLWVGEEGRDIRDD